jgi:hypothetical protein
VVNLQHSITQSFTTFTDYYGSEIQVVGLMMDFVLVQMAKGKIYPVL